MSVRSSSHTTVTTETLASAEPLNPVLGNNSPNNDKKVTTAAKKTIVLDAPNSPSSGAPGALSPITSWFAIGTIITHIKHGVKHKDAESIIKAITEIVKLPLALIKGGGKLLESVISLTGASLPVAVTGTFGVTAGVVVGSIILPVLAVLGLIYLSIEAIKTVSHLVADAVFAHTYKVEDTLKLLKKIDEASESSDSNIAIEAINKHHKLLTPESTNAIMALLTSDGIDYEKIKAHIAYDAINKLVASKVDSKDDAAYKKLYLSRRLGSSAGKAIGENLAVLSLTSKETFLSSENITTFNHTAQKMLETTKVQQKKMLIIHTVGIALIAVAAIGLVLTLATGTFAIPLAILAVAGGILSVSQVVLRTCYLDNSEDNINFRLFIPKFFTKEEVHRPTRRRLWTTGDAKKKREFIAMNIFSLGIVSLIDELKGSPFLKNLRTNKKTKVDPDSYKGTLHQTSSLDLTPSFPDIPWRIEEEDTKAEPILSAATEDEAEIPVSPDSVVSLRKSIQRPLKPTELISALGGSWVDIATPIAVH